MERSDAELWRRVVDGDGAAFTSFYLRHGHRVFTHCLRRTGAQIDAEDLTAEVFALTWQKRSSVVLHAEADILPWLLTTANHLLRRHHRSLRVARRLLARIPRDVHLPDHAEEIVDAAYDAATVAAVLATLDRLRLPDREIIELCVLQGLSPGAVASALGQPAGTVRARLSRALSRARTLHRQQPSPAAESRRPGLSGAAE